MSVLSSGFEHI